MLTFVKTLLSIFFIISLLAQVWPAESVVLDEQDCEACEMGCCVGKSEAGFNGCECQATPTLPNHRDSPGMPASLGAGRISGVAWIPLHEIKAPLRRELSYTPYFGLGVQLPNSQPHVRLTVLFCSFLQ